MRKSRFDMQNIYTIFQREVITISSGKLAAILFHLLLLKCRRCQIREQIKEGLSFSRKCPRSGKYRSLNSFCVIMLFRGGYFLQRMIMEFEKDSNQRVKALHALVAT
jgi:hypothetical protein